MSELRITHTSTVTEDQIDHLGHMNVRYYAVNAGTATRALLAELGWDRAAEVEAFDMYTRHHREQLLGTHLEVRSGLLGADTEAIRIYHELANAETGDLAATFVYRVRTDGPLDHLDTIDLPAHGTPRSIDLDASIAAPRLETVDELGLAMRAPRVLDAADTDGSRTVPLHLAPMLIWGGTPSDGSEHVLVHTGPNGEKVGWATMETRIGVNRLPEVGTRIQSFGATTAIADKTTQMSMWAYDVDSGELLVSFEVVSVLFNIDARRAMSIPDDMRAGHAANLHPELGASV
ncbi:thioesterase family protein [Ilumatobacter sp.]|uniref:thioesterase family protein n=1 Tax=Ilumatobacter sp. TaxID=1967498 RepID=UPI003C5B0FF1